MKEVKRQEAIAAREAREAKAAMKAANEMKATVVQNISKTHKLKVMHNVITSDFLRDLLLLVLGHLRLFFF